MLHSCWKRPGKMIWLLAGLLILSGCAGENYDTFMSEGIRAFDRSDFASARIHFGRALHAKPSDREALFYMGRSYKNDFIYDSALVYLKRADILHPSDREVNEEIYEVSMALQDWELAYSAISALIGTGDPEEKHWAKMGEIWARRDFPGNALFFTEKALKAEPENKVLYIRAATLANIVGGPDSALVFIDMAIDRLEVDEVLLSNRAVYLDKAGHHTEAEAIYRSALAIDSTSDAIRYNLGRSLAAQDDRIKIQEALRIFTELRKRFGYQLPVDSIITDLENRLK